MNTGNCDSLLDSMELDRLERYLDRLLAKVESSKEDLDKNWMAQISSVALSLAVIVGLGGTIAQELFHDKDKFAVLYIILPIVNTFLFARFGLLAGTFSKSRFASQKLAEDITALKPLPVPLAIDEVYKTNSYFEWVHRKYSLPSLFFLLTIPVLFSINHGVTIYLLYKSIPSAIFFNVVIVLYILLCATAYYQYYVVNSENTTIFSGNQISFLVLTIGVASCCTVAVLFGLNYYDPQPDRVPILTQKSLSSDNARQANSKSEAD